MHALGLEFGSAAQLSKRPGSVWNCLWGNALKRSPGIIRKSRVSYPGPGFLSSATWPSLPKKHYNGLNQTITLNKRSSFEHLEGSSGFFTMPIHIAMQIGNQAWALNEVLPSHGLWTQVSRPWVQQWVIYFAHKSHSWGFVTAGKKLTSS